MASCFFSCFDVSVQMLQLQNIVQWNLDISTPSIAGSKIVRKYDKNVIKNVNHVQWNSKI